MRISKELLLSLPHDVFRGIRGEPLSICISMDDVNKLPDKVDAAEVTRCRYCKYYDQKLCGCRHPYGLQLVPLIGGHFCSFGKKDD